MKRILTGLLALSILVSGCATKKEDVSITLPKEFFEMSGTDAETALKDTETKYKSMTKNEDGSVTLVFDGAEYDKYLNEYKTQIKTALDEVVTNDETFPNITKIDYNDDFSQFDVTLESGEVTLMDSLSVLMFYMYGYMYQIMIGKDAGSSEIIVNYVDTSGNIIDTVNSSDME